MEEEFSVFKTISGFKRIADVQKSLRVHIRSLGFAKQTPKYLCPGVIPRYICSIKYSGFGSWRLRSLGVEDVNGLFKDP